MTRDILLSQFAPSASTDTTRQSANRKLVEDIYRPEDAPNGMGWCMALGRWLPRDQLKASHVYQRRWPLGVAVNAFSMSAMPLAFMLIICWLCNCMPNVPGHDKEVFA